MAPSMSPLVVENVRKRFRQGEAEVEALAGISLDVAAGQFLAIMGASGSGKSTLLHLMAGLATADAGRVVVNGTDLASLNDKQLTLFRRRQIGLVFQSFNLIPTLTAEENILKASGRGIFFMRSFMDEVSYTFPGKGGTLVTMVKRRS